MKFLSFFLVFFMFILGNILNAQNFKPISIEDSFYVQIPVDSIIEKMNIKYYYDSLKDINITHLQRLKYEMEIFNVISNDSNFINSILLKNFQKVYRSFYLSVNGNHSYIFVFYSFPTDKDTNQNCNGILSFQDDKCNTTYKYIAIIDLEYRFKPLIFKSTYK